MANNRAGRPPGRRVNGPLIRRLREKLGLSPDMEKRGLSREELAREAGVNPRTVQRAEQGGPISPDSIQRLAKVLGVSPEVLEDEDLLTRYGLAAPPPPVPWAERSAETERILSYIQGPAPRKCCIVGPSGIGKTALARHLAPLLAPHFPGGVIWVTASREGKPVHVLEVQLRIAEALEFRARLPLPEQVSQETFDNAFAAALWDQREQRRLLVLDDILSVKLLDHFIGTGTPGPYYIIATSHLRQVAEQFGEEAIMLDGVSLDDTRKILAVYIDPGRLDTEGVARLHRVLCGIPRSIHIAGLILASEPDTSLGEYAERIRANILDGDQPEALREPETSLYASFEQLRDHVSPNAWPFLAALSVFDEVPFSIDWAMAVGSIESRGIAGRYLAQLTNIYLLIRTPASHGGSDALFRLESHVPIFARTLLGDRRGQVLDALARFARAWIAPDQSEDAEQRIRGELSLWTRILDLLIPEILDETRLRTWDVLVPFPSPIVPTPLASCFVDILFAMAPLVEREPVPGADRWLATAIACALATGRNAVAGRLLLALGRWWPRARLDLQKPIAWLDAATVILAAEHDFSHASAAASEAGRDLFGCNQPVEGFARFEEAIGHARAAHRSGTELACRLVSAAVSFTRTPGHQGWLRAADLLGDALDACVEHDLDSRFVRIVCTSNALVVRTVLTRTGQKSPEKIEHLAGDFAELHQAFQAFERDSVLTAPLFESRLLLLQATHLPPDAARPHRAALCDEACDLWRTRLDDGQFVDEDLLWLLTELAFYVRLYLEHERTSESAPQSELSPVIAGCFGLTDVTREVRVDNINLVPIGLLFPLIPLVSLFDSAFIDRVALASRRVLGDTNRLLDELERIRALQALPPARPSRTDEDR